MPCKRFSHLIKLFAIVAFSLVSVGCGQGDGPAPVTAEPCPADGVVSFDSDSYPESATSAQILVSDTCIGRKEVIVNVFNGIDTIGIDLVVVDGEGAANLNFGVTSDTSNTIAIKEGDVLTATYADANGVVRSDTADITVSTALSTLGVYSETNINPKLAVTEIIINEVLTDRFSQTVSALEGVHSLQADFSIPSIGNENGFAFTFFGLTNPTFEADDASAGNVEGAIGWTTFEFAYTNNTAGPGFGPVSHDAGGSQSLTMFGPFTFDSATGAYQPDNNVVAGESYTATAHVMNWAPDPLAENNLGIMQLTFWDAAGGQAGGGSQIGPAFELLVDSTDDGTNVYLPPQDGADISDWTKLEITQTAPAGTASAEIFLLHIQLNSDPLAQAGSIFWDDISLAGVKDLSTTGEDISSYETLKFGINTSAASGLADLEVKMEDNTGATASVFLSNYTNPVMNGDWAVYTIPLSDFTGLNKSRMISLGFYNASSTVMGSTTVAPTLLVATLYFDDVHFAKPDIALLTGVLVNSPIEGVTFQTATQSGITNANGEFQYLDGETVTFSIGGIVLGTVQGAAFITPVELTGGADPVDQAAINQLVFLQTIDADADYSNGITISAATQAAAQSQTLVFTEPDFSNQVAAVVAAIQDPADPDKSLVDETTALDNFYITYVQLGGTNTFTWSFPPQYPPYPPVVSGANTTIDAAPASVVADGVSTSTITVQAKDTSGNNFTESAGAVLLSTTGSAILSTVADNDNGTYTATVTNTVAEAVTISGTIAGIDIADNAVVTFTINNTPETLGVYSETHTNPVLAYSQIINANFFGGNSTVPDETSTTVTALEGSVSLEADFQDDGQTYGGIIFDFSQAPVGGSNLLLNGGFGSPDATAGDVLCHTDWTCVNGSYTTAADGPNFAPVSHNPEDNQSIKQFGNDGLTFQVVAATPGTSYQASVWAMNWFGNGTTDPFTEFAFVELSFLDAGGNVIPGSQQYVYVDAVDDGTNVYLPPQDGADVSDWTELTLSAVAPAGTVSAKMLLIHQLIGGSGGTIRWDDASIKPVVSELLTNGGFGSPDATAGDVLCHTDWTCVNSSYTTAADGPNFAPVSHNPEDNQSIKQFGNDGLTFQVVAATPGTTYQASVWAMNWFGNGTTDPFTEFAFVELSFLDAGGNTLPGSQYVFVDAVDDGTNVYLPPQDGADVSDWTELTLSAVAPAGTVSAKMLLIHQLIGGSGGTIRWDDASITAAGSAVPGGNISDYETLKFGIDSSTMTGFADLVLQLEDSVVSSSLNLSGYTSMPNQGPGGNWDVYEIPLADFVTAAPLLDLTNIIYLGFWNAQDAGGLLTFGQLYLDDIHFVKGIPVEPVLTGVLLDSPVEGVTFQTATQSGVTNALGEFQYQAGEMVTFSIGDIVLGTVEGAPIITPVELTGSFDPTNQAATNMLVFLQSIDEDQFHANGITISTATQAAAVGQTLDFNLSSVEFTAAVTSVVDTIAPGNTVVSETTALDSFYVTYVDLGGTDTFIWLFPGYPQIGEPGYELIWTDEFNVGTAPSATNWLLETGYGPNNDGWGNNEWQLYTDSPDNVKLENGNLVITADCPTAPVCGVRDGSITSARINTLDRFSFKYGKIAARIKPAVGNGAWPAFWMLGANFPDIGWPFSGEIDVMEMHNAFSDEFTTHFTMHWCDETKQNPATPDVCFPESEGWTYISQFRTFAESLGNDFHVFSAEWDANGIVGKIDGIEYFNLAIDPANMDEFLKEFFVILNVAMGGTLGSNNLPPDGSETWPQTMLVDYVRVYQLIGGDGTYTIGGGSTPSDNTLGVYSETNTNPVLPYVQIIDAAEFGGNSTVPNEFSTGVPALDGSVSLQALFLNSGADYGGIVFNFGPAVYPPDPGPGDGQDISNYATLKFGINTSNVPAFADLKLQLEDGDGTIPGPSVFLSNYTATPAANDWMVYEIPLNDFVTQGLDLTNLTYLGFWNPSSVTAAESPLIFGPLYFDDIHFITGPPAGPNLLTNESFESPDASGGDVACSASWNCFNNNFTSSNFFQPGGGFVNPAAHSGTQVLKQYGVDAGAFQDVAASPGDAVDAQVFAMNWNGDNFNNIFLLQIFALDSSGNNISGGFTPLAQVSAGSDAIVGGTFDYVLAGTDGGNDFDWTQMDVSAVMPAGTASARIQLIHILEASTSNGGAIFLDDARLTVTTP